MADIKYSLKEHLEQHTRVWLLDKVRNTGITGYSKMRKAEIVTLLFNYILDEESIPLKFLAATDKEIKLLEEAIYKKVIIKPETNAYRYWLDFGYAFITDGYKVSVPIEVEEIYINLRKTDEYQNARRINTLIDKYALACVNLYNIIEIEKFIQIINEQNNLEIDEEQVYLWYLVRLGHRGNEMLFIDDGYLMSEIYDESYEWSDDYKEMLQGQITKPYYVPNKSELLEYADDLYVDENSSFRDMLLYFKKQKKYSHEKAYDFAVEIQLSIIMEADPSEIINDLERMGLIFDGEGQIEDFIEYLMEMYNNTRLPVNRGHTPNEIRNMHKSTKDPRTSNVIPYPVTPRTKQKVYPNDPCPCGSGMKYKKCCGKN